MERRDAERALAWLTRWAAVQTAAVALALVLAWAAVLAQLDSSAERLLHQLLLPLAGMLVVLVGCVRTISAWIVIRRARAALDELRIPHGWSGWIIGWFFVPIANLFRPYLGVRALLRGIETGGEPGTAGSSPAPYTASTPLVAWWALSVVTLAVNFGMGLERVDQELLFGVPSLWALGATELLFSAVLVQLGRALVRPLASLRAGTAPTALVRGSRLDRLLPIVGLAVAVGASVASLPPYMGLRDWIDLGRRGGPASAYALLMAPCLALVAAHATARTIRARGESPAAPIGWSFAPLLLCSTVSYARQLEWFLPAVWRSGSWATFWGSPDLTDTGPREVGAVMTAGLLAGATIALLAAARRLDVAERAEVLRSTAAAAALAAIVVGLGAIDAHLTGALLERPGTASVGMLVLARVLAGLLTLAAAAALLATRMSPGARDAVARSGAAPAIVAALALVVGDGLVHAFVGFVTVGMDDWRSLLALLS